MVRPLRLLLQNGWDHATARGQMDYKAVFMSIKRLEQRLAKDKALAKLAQQLTNESQT